MPGSFYYQVSVRQTERGAVRATALRLDHATRRVLPEHVADLLGDISDPREAADLLAYAAEIHRLRVHEQYRVDQAPQGG